MFLGTLLVKVDRPNTYEDRQTRSIHTRLDSDEDMQVLQQETNEHTIRSGDVLYHI